MPGRLAAESSTGRQNPWPFAQVWTISGQRSTILRLWFGARAISGQRLRSSIISESLHHGDGYREHHRAGRMIRSRINQTPSVERRNLRPLTNQNSTEGAPFGNDIAAAKSMDVSERPMATLSFFTNPLPDGEGGGDSGTRRSAKHRHVMRKNFIQQFLTQCNIATWLHADRLMRGPSIPVS